jgi:hypothetical protein
MMPMKFWRFKWRLEFYLDSDYCDTDDYTLKNAVFFRRKPHSNAVVSIEI